MVIAMKSNSTSEEMCNNYIVINLSSHIYQISFHQEASYWIIKNFGTNIFAFTYEN